MFIGRFFLLCLTVLLSPFFITPTKASAAEPLPILFGQAALGEVRFDVAFAEPPLVFLMPSIDADDPRNDGSASVQLTQVTHEGFRFRQVAPPNASPSQPMNNVSWIAIAAGIHQLSNGQQIIAGTRLTDRALIGTDNTLNAYRRVNQLNHDYQVLLTQQQSNNTNCWFTSRGALTSNQLRMALDASEVRNHNRCYPANVESNQFADETLAYLALPSGQGSDNVMLNGNRFRHHVLTMQTGGGELEDHCAITQSFNGFRNAPVVVSDLLTRNGNNGGWLRTCVRTADQYSVVIDEDTFQDQERNHIEETIGVAAFEEIRPTQLHHIELSYRQTPLTCQAETVHFKACANDDCTQLLTEDFSANLSVSNDNAYWLNSSLNFQQGSAQASLQGVGLAPVSLIVSPVEANAQAMNAALRCVRGGQATALIEGGCPIQFADSGFLIEIEDQYANKPTTLTIQAVKRDPSANGNGDVGGNVNSCLPAFANAKKQVSFWQQDLTPVLPNTSLMAQAATLQGVSLTHSLETATALDLNFDAQGKATLELHYAEAGRIGIFASLHSSAQNTADKTAEGAPALRLTGDGNFASIPVGLCVRTDSGSAIASRANQSECNSADGLCSAFKVAGELFPIQITAHAWQADNDAEICDNPITNNYQQANMTISHQLLAPSEGELGDLAVSDYQQSSGAQQIQQSIGEVGVFQLTVTPAKHYLGSLDNKANLAPAISAPIGRFVPSGFQLQTADVQAACQVNLPEGVSKFSYMGQDFPYALTLSARNLAGQVTKNYQSHVDPTQNFAHSQLNLVAEADDNGENLQSRLLSSGTLHWSSGYGSINGTVQLSKPTFEEAPYFDLALGFYVSDFDGMAQTLNTNIDVSRSASQMTGAQATQADYCNDLTCPAVLIDQQDLLYGRVAMDNVYGPSTAALTMALRAEYWQGSHWVVNAMDACTTLGAGAAIQPQFLSQTSNNQGYDFSPILPSDTLANLTSSQTQLNNGLAQLTWQMTTLGMAADYQGRIQAPVHVEPWLQYPWDWKNEGNFLFTNPRASAYFGRYRGHDKVIFWREKR